jgi:MFS family permease
VSPEIKSVSSDAEAAAAVAVSSQQPSRIWIIVLIFGFLGLMVDGMNLMFLSYSLPSLMRDFHISKVQAGSLASCSLVGMAYGYRPYCLQVLHRSGLAAMGIAYLLTALIPALFIPEKMCGLQKAQQAAPFGAGTFV